MVKHKRFIKALPFLFISMTNCLSIRKDNRIENESVPFSNTFFMVEHTKVNQYSRNMRIYSNAGQRKEKKEKKN